MNSKESENRERNPRENASWISILTFSFAVKIFRKGFHREIQEKDVYEIVKDFSSEKMGNRLEAEWKLGLTKTKTWFLSSLFRMFWKEWVALGASLLVIETALMIAYPLLIGKLVSYFTPRQSEVTRNDALLYTAGLILTFTTYTVYIHFYLLLTFELGFKIKIACCSLMYRKCLRLGSISLAKFSNGLVVTLMTKDVLQFDKAIDLGIAVVVGIFQSIILTCMMYTEVGVAALFGVSLVLALFPVQAFYVVRPLT